MKTLGALVALSGVAVLIWVVAQIVMFLSIAVFFPDADWRPQWLLVWLPSVEAVQNTAFLFDGIMGSLLWLAETAFAVILIVTGRRILAAERKDRLEEKQAIDRIIQSRLRSGATAQNERGPAS
jgi:hypothetical protein